jgi:hypothetical protein
MGETMQQDTWWEHEPREKSQPRKPVPQQHAYDFDQPRRLACTRCEHPHWILVFVTPRAQLLATLARRGELTGTALAEATRMVPRWP